MFEVEPTYRHVFQLWWAMLWRIIPLVMIGSFVLGFITAFISHIMDMDKNSMQTVSALVGGAWGLYVTLWVLRRLIIKGFGKYRLSIVEK